MASVLLEAKPYRPFKSSEEYLEAMKEDLAEWLNIMYPELSLNTENFMSRLDTGVALCKHANNVRKAAEDYLLKRQARNKSMTRSITSGLAGPILANLDVHYLPAAKSGTFFARDNVSNFITWCRKSLKIFECLLFETDDLIMRKNEKHVILCLLEVARRGAKFGMLAPMLVQMERQIDREIAADNKANGIMNSSYQSEITGNNQKFVKTEDIFESDSEDEDEGPMILYGPQPQIVTNDLKSLDEMVRDLVEKCTCPSQFPMVRVSEGKYRIGDTKVLIFVRILRSHVMVRVGGGWDTLAHYLDKHDPCRCKSAHRASVAARLIPRTNNQTNGIELHRANVIYERSPPAVRKGFKNNQISAAISNLSQLNNTSSPTNLSIQNRSRSPTPQRKYLNQQNPANQIVIQNTNGNNSFSTSPILNINRRSMSPSPRRLTDIRKKQNINDLNIQSKLASDITPTTHIHNHVQFENPSQLKEPVSPSNNTITITNLYSGSIETSTKFDNVSDNGSEISDEGYRSLGLQQINSQKCELHQQTSIDDADYNARHCQSTCDSEISPRDNENKIIDHIVQSTESSTNQLDRITLSPSPKQIKQYNSTTEENNTTDGKNVEDFSEINVFEQSGIFITDDDITVDIAGATGLRKTGFSDKIYGDSPIISAKSEEKLIGFQNIRPETYSSKVTVANNINSKIPRSPKTIRRRSIDVPGEQKSLTTNSNFIGFNRMLPEYRSARLPKQLSSPESRFLYHNNTNKEKPNQFYLTNNTWNGRNKKKIYSALNEHPIRSSSLNSHFDKKTKPSNSHILYDSSGKRVCSKSTSLTTSPVKCKNNIASPLAQELLKVANNAKNDAQMLTKMKILLQQYSKDSTPIKKTNSDYNNCSYTSEWVHNNGDIERSGSSSSSSENRKFNKELKRNNSVSSTIEIQSSHTKEIPSSLTNNTFLPKSRIDHRGISKIPAPVRRNTELY